MDSITARMNVGDFAGRWHCHRRAPVPHGWEPTSQRNVPGLNWSGLPSSQASQSASRQKPVVELVHPTPPRRRPRHACRVLPVLVVVVTRCQAHACMLSAVKLTPSFFPAALGRFPLRQKALRAASACSCVGPRTFQGALRQQLSNSDARGPCSRRCTPSPSRRCSLAMATKQSRCLTVGAPTPPAHRLAAQRRSSLRLPGQPNKVEPLLAVRARNLPPKTTGGRYCSMRANHLGQRCRGSSNPRPALRCWKGWQGQEPVHTGPLQPASF